MMLLCQNARKFNEEGSQIYSDSLELEKAYLESRAQIDSGLLDFGDSGDEDPSPPTPREQPGLVRACHGNGFLPLGQL